MDDLDELSIYDPEQYDIKIPKDHFIDREQSEQIYILLDWYIHCAIHYSDKELAQELNSIFKAVTEIFYLSKDEIKMVYRYYRYLYGTINEAQQFYTSDEIIFCTKVLEFLLRILNSKSRLNIDTNLQ